MVMDRVTVVRLPVRTQKAVALGIVAVIMVVSRDANRPIPSAQELASAHPIPKVEAAFTTAHQATASPSSWPMTASLLPRAERIRHSRWRGLSGGRSIQIRSRSCAWRPTWA